MARTNVEWLLDDLCVKLGFSLPPAARLRLVEHPPLDIDAFTDAVFTAEGLDPQADKKLREEVRKLVEEHLR